KGVERLKLPFVVRIDRAQQPFGLSQGVAENEGVEGEPKPGRLGVVQPGALKRAVHDLARGMVRGPGGVKTKVQMKDARMAVGEIAIGGRDMAEIGAPVGARRRQLDA